MMKEVKKAFRFVYSSELWNIVLWSIALVSSYLQLLRARIFGSKSTPISGSIDPKIGSSRPICVITGATSGLGKATAFSLAEKGFHVVLEIKRKNKRFSTQIFQSWHVSIDSIFKFKDSLEQWLSDADLHPSIQLLVNNAGTMATSSRPTIEGYDRMIATNYIGPFFMTIESSQVSRDPKLAKQLWETSCDLFNELQLVHQSPKILNQRLS